jgi:hypothetical protein
MSERDVDPRLERELRELLGSRDPGPAPYGLRGRVDRVPEEHPRRDTARARSVALAVAGLAAAAALVVAVAPLAGLRAPWTGPGASPSTGMLPDGTVVPYPGMTPDWGDPTIALDPLTMLPTVLLALAAVLAGVLAYRTVRRRSVPVLRVGARSLAMTPRRQGAAWAVLGVAAVAHLLLVQPLVASVNGWGGPEVLDIDEVNHGQLVAPHPGAASVLMMGITNRSLLPVTVSRPDRWDADRLPLQPERFVTSLLDPAAGASIPEAAPVTLWPGQSISTVVLVRHLPCEDWGVASSPVATAWPTLSPDRTASAIPPEAVIVTRTDVTIAGAVLGIPRRVTMDTGFAFGMVVPTACPPTEAVAPVDLSRVPAGIALPADGGSAGVLSPDDVIAQAPPVVLIVGWVLVVLVAILALRQPGRRRKGAFGAVAAVLALVTLWAGATRPLGSSSIEAGSTWLVGTGGTAGSDALGPGSPDVYDAGPNGTLTFGFSVRNSGAVPVSLVGANEALGQLRVTGLGVPWGSPSPVPADNLILLPGTVINPGQELQLLAVARAGSCVRHTADQADGSVNLTGIPFTWEALGVRHESLVRLPNAVTVPADVDCLLALGEAATTDGSAGVAAFPTASGPGISATEDSPGPLLPVVVLGVVLVAVAVRLRSRWSLLPVAGVAALAAYTAVGVLLPVEVGTWAWGPRNNIRPAEPVPGSEETLWYQVAPPREPYAFMLGVNPTAPLDIPVRLEGIYEPNAWDGFVGTRWRAIWTSDVTGGGIGPVSRPFEPFDLDNRGRGLYMVGEAGECAVGPTYDPDRPPPGFDGWMSTPIRLRVSVLGWPRVVDLPLGFSLQEPTGTCSYSGK